MDHFQWLSKRLRLTIEDGLTGGFDPKVDCARVQWISQ
jgi:hypothetical protein